MTAGRDNVEAPVETNLSVVEQALRCYMVQTSGSRSRDWDRDGDEDGAPESLIAKAIEARGRPYGGFCLIFDTETFAFKDGQRARFGVFQIRGISPDDRRALHEQGSLSGEEFRKALDAPFAWGIFHNPALTDETERGEIDAYVQNVNATDFTDPWTNKPFPKCQQLEVQDFVEDLIYPWADRCGSDLLIVGHNLAFDLGALSVDQGLSTKRWFGGFTIKPCHCLPVVNKEGEVDDKLKCFKHPPIYIKPLGGKKRMFGWRKEGMTETIDGAKVKRKNEIKANFLDTSQFARALLGPVNTSLENLTWEVFKTKTKKTKGFEDYDGPITRDYINYCVNDVQATFEIWTELRSLYRTHGISRKPWTIFSEASLGKGYYEEFGVPKFAQKHEWFPPNIMGWHMQTYYGGRSEVRIRKEVHEVIHTDYKSQYPTVNALLGLQDLLLAEEIDIVLGPPAFLSEILATEKQKEKQTPEQWNRFAKAAAIFGDKADGLFEDHERQSIALRNFLESRTDEETSKPETWAKLLDMARALPGGLSHVPNVQAFLEDISLEKLQDKATWKSPLMRSIVRIIPNGDILPVRAEYEPHGGSTNIGVNIVENGPPVWYAISDAIASKLLTGKTPQIDNAVTLIPKGRVKTRSFPLFGDERYQIDLDQDDLFTRLIDLRTEMQRQGQGTLEKATKLLANSTSYGILAQFNVDRRTGDYKTIQSADGEKSRRNRKPGFPVDVYTGAPYPERIVASRLETPGDYFAGPIATHITAGGRLLLAIAERNATDRDISYVFCDTDSMCFAKPDSIDRDEFRKRVAEIVDWFQPLYPYEQKAGEKPSILQYEKVNFCDAERDKGFEPLYCVAISAKRYALYNRVPFSEVLGRAPFKTEPRCYPLFRKISAHGTGQLSEPEDYLPSTLKPEKEKGLRRNTEGKLEGEALSNRAVADQLLTDVWRKAVLAIEAGRTDFDIQDPQLNVPVISDITLGSRGMWERYEEIPDKRPFMFFSMMPRPIVSKTGVEILGLDEIEETTLYGRRAKSYDTIKPTLRRADNHQPFRIEEWLGMVRHETLNDALEEYFNRCEWKSFPAGGIGPLERRRLIIAAHIPIGKETDQIKDEENEESEGEFEEDTKPDPALERAAVFNREILKAGTLAEWSRRTGYSEDQLFGWKSGGSSPDSDRRKVLVQAMNEAIRDHGDISHVETKPPLKEDELRERISAIVPDWWNIGAAPGDGDRRKQYKPLKGISRVGMKMAELEKLFENCDGKPETWAAIQKRAVSTRYLLTSFMKGKVIDENDLQAISRAVDAVTDDDQRFFDCMCEAHAGIETEYSVSDDGQFAVFSDELREKLGIPGKVMRRPHPAREYWESMRPPYLSR